MFKIPKIHIPKNTLQIILFIIALALATNFIMTKQIMALISLFISAGLLYYISKNVTLSLLISIILTNLLLVTNYLETPNIEQLDMKKDKDSINKMLINNNAMYV